jgi:hypothetical protein
MVASIRAFSRVSEEVDKGRIPLPFDKRVNVSRTLLNLKIQRWINSVTVSNCFNFSGFFTCTGEQTQKGIQRCLQRQKYLPRFTAKWFENQFREQIYRATEGIFAASNQRLSTLTHLDLEQYGYDL